MNSASYLIPGEFALIAHRGGSLENPENTIPAFEHAHRVFPQVVFELDIHRSRDGEIVVMHDDSVDRTTDGHGFIRDLNFAEIEKLDAAYRFTPDQESYPLRGKNVHPPRLADVLGQFPHSRVTIEIKEFHPKQSEEVVRLIRNLGAVRRVVLSSEFDKILGDARKAGPELCSGFGRLEILRGVLATRTGLKFLNPKMGDVFQVPIAHKRIPILTTGFVKNAHQYGKAVHAWTINDEATMRQLIAEKVDGIISDAPSLLLRVAQELKKI